MPDWKRWDIELRLCEVKTLRMALIAYNLIKSSCQAAEHAAGRRSYG